MVVLYITTSVQGSQVKTNSDEHGSIQSAKIIAEIVLTLLFVNFGNSPSVSITSKCLLTMNRPLHFVIPTCSLAQFYSSNACT